MNTWRKVPQVGIVFLLHKFPKTSKVATCTITEIKASGGRCFGDLAERSEVKEGEPWLCGWVAVRGGGGVKAERGKPAPHLKLTRRLAIRDTWPPAMPPEWGPRVSDTDYSYLHIICLDTQSDKSLKHVSGVGGGEATIFVIPPSPPFSLLFLDNLKKL